MAFGAPTAAPAGGPPKPAAPAAPPSDGAKAAPFGSSSASQATPNAGADAVAYQAIGAVVTLMQNVLVKVGAMTEPGKALIDAMKILTKAVPAGSVTPAVVGNQLDQAKMQNTQNGAMQQQMRQRALSAGAPGGGAPGAGAPPGPGAPA